MRLKIALVGATIFILNGCGGGGGGGGVTESTGGTGDTSGVTPVNSQPSISNLVVTPTTATQNQGSGTINIGLSMNFVDARGDVASFTLNIFDLNNNQLSTHSYPISGVSGLTSGVINGIFAVSTTTVGNYTYKVYVSDTGALNSNTMTGTFTITTPSTTQSTALITSYLSTSYLSETTAVNNDIATIKAQAAANGQFGSGSMAVNILNAKIARQQSFLNGAVSYVQTTKASYAIDKPTIVSLLSSYNTQDLAWPSSFVIAGVAAGWLQNLSGATTPPYSTSINNNYSSAIAQINAL